MWCCACFIWLWVVAWFGGFVDFERLHLGGFFFSLISVSLIL